jgi:hypothetical protein
MRKLPVTLAMVACAGALGACEATVPSGRTGATTVGSGVSLAKVERPRPQPQIPKDAVLLLWRDLRHGSLLTAMDAYDADVVRFLGTQRLLGALALVKARLGTLTAQITGLERSPLGSLVFYRVVNEGKLHGRGSYLLRRRGAEWKVTYDSELREAVASYVQRQLQTEIDPKATLLSPQAVRRGDRVADQYAALFAPSAGAPDPPTR